MSEKWSGTSSAPEKAVDRLKWPGTGTAATDFGGGAPTPIRIVPVSATEAYLVAPHAALGAIALHLLKGNGASTATPADSVGAPFGDWRIQGFRILPGVDSDPATQTTEILSSGIGAQQLAIRRTTGGGWVGHYHGFGAGATYAQTAPDMTVAAMIATAEIASTGRGLWSDAAYVDFRDVVRLTAAGAIETATTATMPFDPNVVYLDMTIAAPTFIRASLDNGATWVDLTTLTAGNSALDKMAANVATVILRNPSTGTTITVTDDALNGTAGRYKEITRRTADFKIYADLNPTPAGTLLGTATVNRSIIFGRTTPDPTVTLSGDVTQAEGNSGTTAFTFTVTRSATAGAASIPWTFSAGTTSADDFVGGTYPTGGSVALADGQASATFVVGVAGDAVVEANETFGVAITAPLGFAPGARMSAAGGITNDDGGVLYLWDGTVNGDSGFQNPTTSGGSGYNPSVRSWDATNKQLVFTRNAASPNHRTLFAMSGLTPGATYNITVTGQIVGSGASAGVQIGVSTDVTDGGSQTYVVTMTAAIAAGTTAYSFVAPAASCYLVWNVLVQSGSDNVFRLSRLGEVKSV